MQRRLPQITPRRAARLDRLMYGQTGSVTLYWVDGKLQEKQKVEITELYQEEARVPSR